MPNQSINQTSKGPVETLCTSVPLSVRLSVHPPVCLSVRASEAKCSAKSFKPVQKAKGPQKH